MPDKDDQAPDTPRPKKAKRRPLGRANSAIGLRLYVTGECKTFREVADHLHVSPSAVAKAAARDGWTRQRAEYAEERSRQALAAANRAEVQAAVRSRRLAWASAQLALKSIARRLERGEINPRPHEVEAIVRTALALSGAAVDSGSLSEELEKYTLLEITERTVKQIEEGLGAK